MNIRRVLLRWVGLQLLVLMVLATGFSFWLLHSAAGRELALRQLREHLPNGALLSWQSAEGHLAGPLTLRNVQFKLPVQRDSDCVATPSSPCAMAPLQVRADRLTLDLALWPLLTKRVQFDALQLSDASIDLPRSDTAFKFPAWPDVLPTLDLPLEVRADTINIDRVRLLQEGTPQLTLHTLRGGLRLGRGWLTLQQLQLDSDRGALTAHGSYRPRQNFRTNLTAHAAFPAAPGHSAAQLDVTISGDLTKLKLQAKGQLPGATQLNLELSGESKTPRWQLTANTEALNLALLSGETAPKEALRFALDARGVGGLAQLQGQLQQGDFSAVLQPSSIQLQEQKLTLKPLTVDLLDGRVEANGFADLHDPKHTAVQLALTARGLRWRGANADAITIQGDADLNIAGSLEQWQINGQTRLQRAADRATVDLRGQGNRSSIHFDTLTASMPQGQLQASGDLQWLPTLRWDAGAQLSGFDPGYFLPDWPGNLHGRLSSQGELADSGALKAHIEARQLRGQLRQRALSADATLDIQDQHYAGELTLALGKSRLRAKGQWGDTLTLDASATPLQLNDLLPSGSGQLQGTLQLRGAHNAPTISADLSGSALALGDYRVQQLSAHGHLPWQRGSGTLAINAHGIALGTALDTLQLTLQGAVSNLHFDANANSATLGALTAQGTLQQRGTGWQGTLDALKLTPSQGSAWTLQQGASGTWNNGRFTLASSCLQAAIGGTLCAHANWPRDGLTLQGKALPLALLADVLPKQDNGRPWAFVGSADLDAQLVSKGSAWQANVQLHSDSGGLRQRQRARRDLFSYRALQLVAKLDANRIEASASAQLGDNGKLDAQLNTGWSDGANLVGNVQLSTRELTWMELFSPDIVAPSGQLDVNVQLSGKRAQPLLAGAAQLQDFATELPALGIDVHHGHVELLAQADGSARIQGSVRSGDNANTATLQVDGRLGWQDDTTPLQLRVYGSNILLADTRQLRLLASPDLQLNYRAGSPLQVRGSVSVPEADLHLERLEMSTAPSADVVVLDPVKQMESAPLATDIDLTVAVGERVHIDGYGLSGTLAGSLRVRQPPGRDTRATGALEIGGRYRAYGQDLSITQGKLVWSNTEIGDPLLDIRAERVIGDVTAGVSVKGRASAPQASVWSNPAMSQSEALAYLTLGRPLPSLSSREAEQINVAKSALNAGAGLLASQLGKHIGLDDAGVSQSRALGGEVLGLGKYLSPKLYVSYGVSLLGTGQVVTFKYLLRKGFDLQIESSTLENRASVNWRTEK